MSDQKKTQCTKGVPLTTLLVGSVQDRVLKAILMGGRSSKDFWCEFMPHQLACMLGLDPADRAVRTHIRTARTRLEAQGKLEKHPEKAAWREPIPEGPDGWIDQVNLYLGGKRSTTKFVHPWKAIGNRDDKWADSLPRIFLEGHAVLESLTGEFNNLTDFMDPECLKFWALEFPAKAEKNNHPGWGSLWGHTAQREVKEAGLELRDVKCQALIVMLAAFFRKTGQTPKEGKSGIFKTLNFFGGLVGKPQQLASPGELRLQDIRRAGSQVG